MSVFLSTICPILSTSQQIRLQIFCKIAISFLSRDSRDYIRTVNNKNMKVSIKLIVWKTLKKVLNYSLRVHSIFNQLSLKNIFHQMPTLVFVTITVYQCLFTYISFQLSTFSHILNYLPQNALLIAQKLPMNFWNAFPHL